MNSDSYWTIIGVVISFVVALVTIWQGVLTRKHNRLSVKPLLRIDRHTVVGEKAKVMLLNVGIGPAIVKNVKLYYEGHLIHRNDQNPPNTLLNKIGIDASKYRIFEIYKQESFSSGENISLYESMENINDSEMALAIERMFDKAKFEIEYESIYGDKFILFNSGNQSHA